MNLYSINTIKQGLSFSPLIYNTKQSEYSESLILNYTDADGNVQQEILGANRSINISKTELAVSLKALLSKLFKNLFISVSRLSFCTSGCIPNK